MRRAAFRSGSASPATAPSAASASPPNICPVRKLERVEGAVGGAAVGRLGSRRFGWRGLAGRGVWRRWWRLFRCYPTTSMSRRRQLRVLRAGGRSRMSAFLNMSLFLSLGPQRGPREDCRIVTAVEIVVKNGEKPQSAGRERGIVGGGLGAAVHDLRQRQPVGRDSANSPGASARAYRKGRRGPT